jgi:hypothetical protein
MHSHVFVSLGRFSLDGIRWIALQPGDFRHVDTIADRFVISNGRRVAIEGGDVTFRYKDFRDGER